MSFPDDTRPDTRKYVVVSWVLRSTPILSLAIGILIQILAPEELKFGNAWDGILSALVVVGLLGPAASIFVDRAKKKADARWALHETQKRTEALAARLRD